MITFRMRNVNAKMTNRNYGLATEKASIKCKDSILSQVTRIPFVTSFRPSATHSVIIMKRFQAIALQEFMILVTEICQLLKVGFEKGFLRLKTSISNKSSQ